MAYTPELSQQHSATLRRLAWALDVPMTQALAMVIDYMPTIVDREQVCARCQDKSKCSECLFYNQTIRKEQSHDQQEGKYKPNTCNNLPVSHHTGPILY